MMTDAAREEAVRLFDETRELLNKNVRTQAEDALMLHKAHTSCYLWRAAESPLHSARGEWQVSRVYSVLGMGRLAVLHGNLSLDTCLQNKIGGSDLAFGYEAVARGYALLGDQEKMEAYKLTGLDACMKIDEREDQEYVMGELMGIGL